MSKEINTTLNRRKFLKVSSLAGGGMLLNFSFLAGCEFSDSQLLEMPKEWFELNSYIKIGDNGLVTLYSANPEFGSNIKTSMPMILAEELEINWEKVLVEQADYYPDRFERQFTGGSQGIRRGWEPLRTAGATAKKMLVQAAAQLWQTQEDQVYAKEGMLFHDSSERSMHFGEAASLASTLEVPEEVSFKSQDSYTIIGKSKKNVDADKIYSGAPLFGIDHYEEGMLTAMIVHPPAFGMELDSFDADELLNYPGITDVFEIKVLKDDYARNFFDGVTFTRLVAIVGESTWQVMKAKKVLKVSWRPIEDQFYNRAGRGGNVDRVKIPAGLENSREHYAILKEKGRKKSDVLRRDGDPEKAFKNADVILERTYTAPFLAHNTMEPMNCFAHVTDDSALLYGPTQAPEFIRGTLAHNLEMDEDKIQIKLARMGGGFGRRAYSHHMVEAALISQKAKAPVKLIYTREDDMTSGIYRPTYTATYRAALDKDKNLIGFHVCGGGIPESPVYANRFPAGCIDNYLAESWSVDTNLTIGAFRAPRSNFIAGAEQSFLDELAQLMEKDPVEFRLELLQRAQTDPVGNRNDYDANRYAGVIELARDKSNWANTGGKEKRGFAAYFCHNTYVAEVLELKPNSTTEVNNVIAAVDCGIVVNPDSAINMAEGGIVDGIGNALYGDLEFKDGTPSANNFDKYKIIRQTEAPKSIEVYFVENNEAPTGLGEPLFPPVFAALSNAISASTDQRVYEQPFVKARAVKG